MRVVIRIGGAVVASPPNPRLFIEYAETLRDLKSKGHELAAVVGGGSMARDVIQIAKEMNLTESEQDTVAILVTRLFAQLLVFKLGECANEKVPTSVDEAVAYFRGGKIVVMGGVKPGMTTDAVAATIAKKIDANLLVKATDQDGVYTRDPKKYPSAKKIDALSFDELFKWLEESKHKVGMHQILDPEAVHILQKERTKTIITNGFYPKNVELAIQGEMIGTVIQ